MTALNFKNSGILFLFCLWALLSGCASQPQPNTVMAVEPSDVHFASTAPANARFIAKIPYASGSDENWQKTCITYLTRKAAKLGGNIVVPGIELDFGSYKVQPGDSRFSTMQPPSFVRTVNATGQIVTMPGKFHFWSSVYYCSNSLQTDKLILP